MVVDTCVRERLSSPAWRTPFISQYPNAYPLVDRVGVRLFLVVPPRSPRSGIQIRRAQRFAQPGKVPHRKKGNKRPCKQAPSKLAWFEGKLPVLFTPYSLLSTRCNTSQLNIYSLITQYPEVVYTSNPYSFTLPGKFRGFTCNEAVHLLTDPGVAASRALVTSAVVAKR